MAADRDYIIAEVRFLLGGLSVGVADDALLEKIIDRGVVVHGDDVAVHCELIYYTILETLRYLIRGAKTAAGGSTQAAGAVVEEQEEWDGMKRITKYSDGGGEVTDSVAAYEEILRDFLADPTIVCAGLGETVEAISQAVPVFFGGTSKAFTKKVKQNTDSQNAFNKLSFVDRHFSRDQVLERELEEWDNRTRDYI